MQSQSHYGRQLCGRLRPISRGPGSFAAWRAHQTVDDHAEPPKAGSRIGTAGSCPEQRPELGKPLRDSRLGKTRRAPQASRGKSLFDEIWRSTHVACRELAREQK